MISKTLINWYEQNKRDLPWRNTTNPYHIWISEIILQQTQVVQGLPYYERFISKFPDVNTLASAHEDEVLKLWQGLGYYSRARNLQFSAKYIVTELNGKFPTTFLELKKLKGVGDYTAAAIASFCYKEVVPVVDGNVLRFIARYYGIEDPIDSPLTVKKVREICSEVISKTKPDSFNQAIMEFGSQVCKPNSPDCINCPFQKSCWAFGNKKVNEIPFKTKKIKKRNRYFYYLYVVDNDSILIEKRTENDIWKGLFQLPLIEVDEKLSDKKLNQQLNELGLLLNNKSAYKKHLLSHQTIFASLAKCKQKNGSQAQLTKNFPNALSVKLNELERFPIPRLLEMLLEQ